MPGCLADSNRPAPCNGPNDDCEDPKPHALSFDLDKSSRATLLAVVTTARSKTETERRLSLEGGTIGFVVWYTGFSDLRFAIRCVAMVYEEGSVTESMSFSER